MDPMGYDISWLVGGFNLPLWILKSSSVGMMTFPINMESHSKFHGSSHHQPDMSRSLRTISGGFYVDEFTMELLEDVSFGWDLLFGKSLDIYPAW